MRKPSRTMGVFLAAVLAVGVSGCASITAGTAQQRVATTSSGPATAPARPTSAPAEPTSAPATPTSRPVPAPETSSSAPSTVTRTPPRLTQTVVTPPSTTHADSASAADAVAPFLAAAAVADRNITAAAAAVNASFKGKVVTFDQATMDLVAGAEPSAAGAAIDAGLDPALERALLLVYSDLRSRYAALHGESCVWLGTFALDQLDPHCFVEGHAAAVRFAGDVAAAEQLAAAAVAPEPVGAGSPAAAEPAVRVGYIDGNNEGCGGHGGFLATAPIDVQWAASPSAVDVGSPLHGQANGVRFTATYNGDGWSVRFLAC